MNFHFFHDWTGWGANMGWTTTTPPSWKVFFQTNVCTTCGAIKFRHVRSDFDAVGVNRTVSK